MNKRRHLVNADSSLGEQVGQHFRISISVLILISGTIFIFIGLKTFLGMSFSEVTKANTVLSSKYELLSDIYATYSESPGFDHWATYGYGYDENIHELREKALLEDRKLQMLEIGVQSGGSTRVWKRYFRGTLAYVGLDIDPRCRKFQSLKEGIRIIAGSQSDTSLLSDICNKFGPFDLIIDDGGHSTELILTSLGVLWNCLKDDSVYVIEDLHTMNMGASFLSKSGKSVLQEIAEWMRVRSPAIRIADNDETELQNHPSRHLKKLMFYDSIVFLHYATEVPKLARVTKGTDWLVGKVEKPKKKLSLSDWCRGCCIGCYDA